MISSILSPCDKNSRKSGADSVDERRWESEGPKKRDSVGHWGKRLMQMMASHIISGGGWRQRHQVKLIADWYVGIHQIVMLCQGPTERPFIVNRPDIIPRPRRYSWPRVLRYLRPYSWGLPTLIFAITSLCGDIQWFYFGVSRNTRSLYPVKWVFLLGLFLAISPMFNLHQIGVPFLDVFYIHFPSGRLLGRR